MPSATETHEFYGFKLIQNPSNARMTLYVGAMDANILRNIVSVDNAVHWDNSSEDWVDRGRNRAIIDKHWQSIKEFLTTSNNERILPSPIVISVEDTAFEFEPFARMAPIQNVTPGIIKIKGKYSIDENGTSVPVPERERTAWVLDGQHRITAFRNWSMPDPYPLNVVILPAWRGPDYDDIMRHQTYELNMGRPLDDDFKASIRQRYNIQIGHREYKKEIALSWIRKNIESRGRVFSYSGIVGAPRIRTPYIIRMSTLENILLLAHESDEYLSQTYQLDSFDLVQAAEVGKYLYNFYEGVRLSLGLINPRTKGTIGPDPEVNNATDYWDIAQTTTYKQRILHNVGLKAITKGLLHKVMRDGDSLPQSPEEVAQKLDHLRGIPWHDTKFLSMKDDWVNAIAEALVKMYNSEGTHNRSKKYSMTMQKRDAEGNLIGESYTITANGW